MTKRAVAIYDVSLMPQSVLVTADAVCTAKDLCDVLGLTMRTLNRLTDDGVLVHVRSAKLKNAYSLRDSVRAYIKYRSEYIRRECSTGDADYDLARTRRMRALAAKEELELAKARGEVLNREHTLLVLTNSITVMKNHVLAIASRCSRRVLGLKTQAEVHAAIRADCERSLSEISNIDASLLVEQTFKRGKNGARDNHASSK